MSFFQKQMRAGEAVAFGGRQIVPLSVSRELMIPGKPGGLIVNRPHSVTVIEADGSERSIPVPRPASKIQFILPGLMLFILIIKLITRANRRPS
ncbi:MAG: hypothetical protein M1455_09620 [Actinobacteria bacterium]|nr:hypothetical protein [Actinomycetota bacterium]